MMGFEGLDAQQLRRTAALGLLGRLAASMGHALRNSLSIQHMSVFMIKHAAAKGDPASARDTQALEFVLVQLQGVVDDLHAVGDLSEGRPAPFDLYEACDDAVKILDRAGLCTHLHVEVSPRPQGDTGLVGWEAQMRHALLELLLNSLTALSTAEEREQRLQVKLSPSPAPSRWRIEVHDSGPGLDATDRALALQPGWSKAGGKRALGLGLSAAAVVAENHGGTLELSESPLGGLQVSLDLGPAKAES